MAVNHQLFIGFVLLIAMERVAELFISMRNEQRLLEKGAFEVGREHFVYMKLLHTLWFFSILVESSFQGPPPWLQFYGLGFVLVVCQVLRYIIISQLQGRWTVNVVVLPSEPPITHGLYKWVRHPNYWVVVIEIALLPLMYNAYFTAFAFTLLNMLLLKERIAVENNVYRATYDL